MSLAATAVRATDASARRRRMASPFLVAGGITAATLALHFRDPHAEGSWGLCPSAALGFSCPGCGGLRAVNDLTDLRFLDAVSSNLLFVATIPLFAWIFWRWSAGRWTGRAWDPDSRIVARVSAVLIAAMVVFSVVRNTPAGSWLAP
ncbi:DUF2752 domain-containing protein [Nocardioides carbamazepini]|uniref:DUF2752 domain-containing protein n=1 Tax=Nocardioides carbamazepini TaxID=2854259 RepID=UPI00214A749D|nr:DUF2752 domain-containing protein [Nocardioides carbamazepini]MCR1781583.1 DUF2752 domain-containing protein [Nocardioides carbamazepini]